MPDSAHRLLGCSGPCTRPRPPGLPRTGGPGLVPARKMARSVHRQHMAGCNRLNIALARDSNLRLVKQGDCGGHHRHASVISHGQTG